MVFNHSRFSIFNIATNQKDSGPVVCDVLFVDERILPLARFIGITAGHFDDGFNIITMKGEEIISYIDSNY